MDGLFTLIYTWFQSYVFGNIGTLPVVVQGIVPELCTLVSLFCLCAVIAVPCIVVVGLFRSVLGFGRL